MKTTIGLGGGDGALSDFAYCVQETTDGGYIVAGSAGSLDAGGQDGNRSRADGSCVQTAVYAANLLSKGLIQKPDKT